MKTRLLLALASFVFLFGATGCNDFEKTAFKTLSASKAVLDLAQTDYEPPPVGTGKLPHSACVYSLINDGKAAQVAGVTALQAYDTALTAKTDLTASTTNVTADIAQLGLIIVKIKALYTNPAC